MQFLSNQHSSGSWLGLPPDEERPVSRAVRYRCIFLTLLYWAVLSAIHAGLFLNLLINLALPAGAMWGDLPASGPYARREPGVAGYAAPFPAILGSRHLCLPLRQRGFAPASRAVPGLVVPALRGPREHGHGGVRGHPGAAGHHRPHPRLHAPGGKTILPAMILPGSSHSRPTALPLLPPTSPHGLWRGWKHLP